MSKVAVIIPVYNAEKYMEKCINSVLSQTFNDFECILVDDGSLDNSGKICDEYAKKDERIKVIHQKNAGPARARHTGIEIAKANFIHFVDSDDWIEPCTIELFYKKQQETGADIVIEKGTNCFYPNKQKILLLPNVEPAVLPIAYFFMYNCKGHWNKLYKKNLFQDLYYPPKSPSEDFITNTQVFSKVNYGGLAQIDKIVYNYNLCDWEQHISYINYSTAYNKPYSELPVYSELLWIEKFLEKSKFADDKSIWSAFNSLVVTTNIIPYFRDSKFMTKNESKMLYKRYYKNCDNKKDISFSNKILMELLVISPFLGKSWRVFRFRILPKIKFLIFKLLKLEK